MPRPPFAVAPWRRPWASLLAALAVAVVAGFGARGLALRTSFGTRTSNPDRALHAAPVA